MVNIISPFLKMFFNDRYYLIIFVQEHIASQLKNPQWRLFVLFPAHQEMMILCIVSYVQKSFNNFSLEKRRKESKQPSRRTVLNCMFERIPTMCLKYVMCSEGVGARNIGQCPCLWAACSLFGEARNPQHVSYTV